MADASDLKPAQLGLLAGVAAAPREGYNAAQRDPAMAGLQRRGLIEWRGARATPRVLRWHLTLAGWDALNADRERRGLAALRRRRTA